MARLLADDMLIYTRQFKLTRIAPTPSGYLHLGNVYSFALTAAIARNTGADVLLRIDDLDRERLEISYVNDIFDTLNFLSIPWQKGPQHSDEYKSGWSQQSRLGIYQPALEKLVQTGNIFACTCSRKQLQIYDYKCTCADKNTPLDTPNAAWRIRTDQRVLTINTFKRGTVKSTLPEDMTNFIVRKKDGYPAYQVTSLLDDAHFGVDLIVRGADLLTSTIAQHYLASVLGIESFSQSTFHHHKLIMADNGAKLSKSAGSTSIQYLRAQGMSSAEVFAQIGRMLSPGKELSRWQDLSHNL